ncbi:hypothetical protein [Nostoc sp. 'Peltigera malacea cyanobiont' DB3992]|nr:hypothetical protein [Nostoc sp. 'Peltigera malacea cyanobiont' DB3992]
MAQIRIRFKQRLQLEIIMNQELTQAIACGRVHSLLQAIALM